MKQPFLKAANEHYAQKEKSAAVTAERTAKRQGLSNINIIAFDRPKRNGMQAKGILYG